MAAGLVALGDDDVDAHLDLLARLRRTAHQRGDLDAVVVGELDHVGRRRTEGVGEQGDGMAEGDVDVRARLAVGPAEQGARTGRVIGESRNAVALQDLRDEAAVLVGDHRLQRVLEPIAGGQVGARGGGGHHHVHTVRTASDVLVDPATLDLELLGGEGKGAEHAHAAGAADRGHHVTAVAEGEDGELEAEGLGDAGAHLAIPLRVVPPWQRPGL